MFAGVFQSVATYRRFRRAGGYGVCNESFCTYRARAARSLNLENLGVWRDSRLPVMAKGKKQAESLEAALLDIERSFGAGSVMRLGEVPRPKVDTIPTGSAALDNALGIGGLPRGRMVEVFGPEASGKTTLVQHVLANAQAQGLACAFIDAEHAVDIGYAERCGVVKDSLLFSQPNSGEDGLEIAQRLMGSGEVGVLAIDSVAALAPRSELAGEMGEATVGAQARMMAQAMRKLVPLAHHTNTLVVFTNQIREAIGVMFGSPERQPGGRALKFAASVRLDIRRIETVKVGGEAIANKVRVKVVKNKLAAPHQVAEFEIRYGKGIYWPLEALEAAVMSGSIDKSGSWFTLQDGTRCQGENAVCQAIEERGRSAWQ